MTDGERLFKEMFGEEEDLDPELALYLTTSDVVGQVLKHPLVFHVPYHSRLAGLANRQLRGKREALASAKAEENWHSYVFLHERAYRAEALLEVVEGYDLTPEQRGEVVRTAWLDTENAWQAYEEWAEVFADEETRPHLMDDDERASLAAMDDPLTVYRGCVQDQNEEGFSWTLDVERARWFARRLGTARGGAGCVIVGKVAKADVVAFLTGRGEEEVVVDPQHVEVERVEEVA